MKIRIFAAIMTLMLIVSGAVSTNVYAETAGAQMPPVEEIQELLTDLLPAFLDFYGYDLVADLNRAGLTLEDFSMHLHNYLNFLVDADILGQQEFATYGANWLFYFVDGIVMQMSEADASHWGNVSLKGLVLNNIYVSALGLDFLGGFFSHRYISQLADNLEIAAYFDFLMRDASIAAVIPFGAAARAYFEDGETEALAAVIGFENAASLGPMAHHVRVDFLAGLLIDRMAADLDYVIYSYADFIVIPSPDLVVPVSISGEAGQQYRDLTFFRDTAFEVNTDIGNAPVDIFVNNAGEFDLVMTLQTYDTDGGWHIFTSEFVSAGEYVFLTMPAHEDLDSFFKVTIYSRFGEIIAGEFAIAMGAN